MYVQKATMELGSGRSLYLPKGSANLHLNIDRNRRVQSIGCGLAVATWPQPFGGNETEQFPMDDLHELCCAELHPNNETAEVKRGQANRHFMAPLARPVRPMICFNIISAPTDTRLCGSKDLRDPNPEGRRISCLSAMERVVLHVSWDNSLTQPGCQH
jgi:hypothetical protein